MRFILTALLITALPAYAEDAATHAPTAPTPPTVQAPANPTPPHIARLANEPPMAATTTPTANAPRPNPRMPRAFSPLAGDFADFTAGKTAFLHAELLPTPAQEGAFTAFIEALKTYTSTMNTHRDTMRDERQTMQADNQLTLPTKLGLRIGAMEEDVQSLKSLQLALANLYAKLTPEQATKADTLLGFLAR